jgi:hypothetical protein
MRPYIDVLREDEKTGGAGAQALAVLPHNLAPVLRALCVHSTPKVAKAAALAVAGVCLLLRRSTEVCVCVLCVCMHMIVYVCMPCAVFGL